MTYQALARQWRPQSLSQLVGQPYVVRALTNALSTGRLHHAYLFSGTRGVGKTSVARILAKSLNCQSGVTAEPCRQCETCLAIENGHFPDLIEVDAASNTKVEDTRSLLENVPYAPTIGRYKVYLIDEVHMLSNHSFNVLLKTLEEPPPHVIFILATTEPERLPVTVLSRCLQFQLQNVSLVDIEQQLASILQHEKITFEEGALEPIAISAKGSMRDALSLLERAIIVSQGPLTVQAVQQWLGAASFEQALELVVLLANQQSKELLNKAQEALASGTLAAQLLDRLLQVFHEVSILQTIPDAPALQRRETLLALSTQLSPEINQLFYQIALIGKRDLAYAPSPEMGLTMTLMRLLSFYPNAHFVGVGRAQSAGEARLAPTRIMRQEEQQKAPVEAVRHDSPVLGTPSIEAWTNLLPKLPLAGLIKVLVDSCICESWEANTITLILDNEQKPIFSEARLKALQQAVSDVQGSAVQVMIKFGDVQDRTPMKQAQAKQQALESQLKAKVDADPMIQSFVQEMGAIVESAKEL